MQFPSIFRPAASFRARLLRALPVLALTAFPILARESVVEDTPARLVLEVEVPAPKVEAGADGHRVSVAGFEQAVVPGAPSLPWYGFQVATGHRTPSVSIEALEWVELSVPRGVAGVRRPITTRESEPYKDPALFTAARGLNPQLSDAQLYRGLTLRKVSLPLAVYTEGSGRVRVMKKFRVTVGFASPATAPAAGVRPWLVQAAVKNLNGGQYLVSLPRRKALRRGAAATVLGTNPRLKIRIGDRQMDGFQEDGVYTLSYQEALNAGLQSAIPVNKLRLYTGPNDVLGVPMDSLVEPTLREIPIEVVDANGDSTFNEGDRIQFYAHGTSLWKPIAGATGPVQWEFKHDPYSFENYYFLDWSGTAGGARLGTTAFIPGGTTVTSVPHYLRGEKDLGTGTCDLARAFDPETGYEWYWHGRFYCTSTSSSVTLAGAQIKSAAVDTLVGRLPTADTAWIGVHLFNPSGTSADDFDVWSGLTSLQYVNIGVNGAWYTKAGLSATSGNLLGLDSIRWFVGLSEVKRLDGYTVRYTRSLDWTGRSQRVFPAASGQRVVYSIQTTETNLRVLRIAAGVARQFLALEPGPGAVTFSDSAGVGEDVYYFVYQPSQNLLPLASSSVSVETTPTSSGLVQNLTTGDGKDPEYLIITSQALLADALTLRSYREDIKRQIPLVTAVVRTEDIYREWSGGRLSPVAIRDFLRFAMNRWGTGGTQGRLKYVVLYGDGHYDYRDIRNGSANSRMPNHVPPFNWDDGSSNPMNTDDFFAILDSGEVWTTGKMDLSIGRLPLQSREHAIIYQNKISRYENPATAGEWRSRILLTGDDDMQRSEPDDITNHTQQAEHLGDLILAADSGMREEKLYLFDYDPNGAYLKPEATQDLLNIYNRGVLFSTFFGHGAYNQMADEVLLKTNDGLSRFRNEDRLFMMSIFSCTVGRFDKLADEGMGEQFLRLANYGAIATFAASRESYPGQNEHLGRLLSARLFEASADSTPRAIGDAVRLAKVAVTNFNAYNEQKYVLEGEPVMVIHRPGLGLQLEPLASDSLQALGCDTLRGRVTKGSGKGRVSIRILSSDVPKTYRSDVADSIPVQKRGQILFERTVDYTDSAFAIGYFLPKKVPFGDTAAKIQVFAWDKDSLRESAALISDLKISGSLGSCVDDVDGLGPRIAVSGCNIRESGNADFPDKIKISLPYCLQITVSDSVGGVLAGEGPDEGTTVEVVGSVAPFHPQAGVDDLYSKTYQVTLTNQDLGEGSHLLKVSARDGFGNRGTRQINLQVAQDTALRFVRAFNSPNPLKKNGTTFHFSTTLPVEEGGALESPRVDRVRFHLRIFNQQGYMVQEFRNALSGETRWNGNDAWGRRLANGVYFYQVTATWGENDGSPQGGRQVSKKQVLVISR